MAMAIGRTGDTATFAACMDLFNALGRSSGIEAFAAVAKTFRDWRAEIVNYAPAAERRTASLRASLSGAALRVSMT